MSKAKRAAERMLRTLGKEDTLYTHHGDVHARPEAYTRLASMIDEYAGHACALERERIIDAIRERGNKWASLTDRDAAVARKAMYEIADELEKRWLAP